MNVSNGTPGQNTGDNSGFNTQPNQSIQRPQQSMGNTQQPNLSKPNNLITKWDISNLWVKWDISNRWDISNQYIQ